MNLAHFGIVFSLGCVIAGAFIVHSAPLLAMGFIGFAAALGCLDDADNKQYVRNSDALNAHNLHRVGFYDQDRAA